MSVQCHIENITTLLAAESSLLSFSGVDSGASDKTFFPCVQ